MPLEHIEIRCWLGVLHKLKLGWHLVLKGVGLKSSTFRLFLMNEKGCTKFEHTLRVCIAVLSFWGLMLRLMLSIFLWMWKGKETVHQEWCLYFFHCTTQTGCGQLGTWAKKADKRTDWLQFFKEIDCFENKFLWLCKFLIATHHC